jgi:hypothetical protein
MLNFDKVFIQATDDSSKEITMRAIEILEAAEESGLTGTECCQQLRAAGGIKRAQDEMREKRECSNG